MAENPSNEYLRMLGGVDPDTLRLYGSIRSGDVELFHELLIAERAYEDARISDIKTQLLEQKYVMICARRRYERLLKDFRIRRSAASSRVTDALRDGEEVVYDVELTSAGSRRGAVAVDIRRLSGLTITEVREIINSAPKVFIEGIRLHDAEYIKRRLEAKGATAALRVSAPTATDEGDNAYFDIELTGWHKDKLGVVYAIGNLLNLSLSESRKLLETVPAVIMEGEKKEIADAARKALELAGAGVVLKRRYYTSDLLFWLPTVYAWSELPKKRLCDLLAQLGWESDAPAGEQERWCSPSGEATFGISVQEIETDTAEESIAAGGINHLPRINEDCPTICSLKVERAIYRDAEALFEDVVRSTQMVIADESWSSDGRQVCAVAFGPSLHSVLLLTNIYEGECSLLMFNEAAIKRGLLASHYTWQMREDLLLVRTPEEAFEVLAECMQDA